MPRVSDPIDANELVELYATGVTLAHCARHFRTRSTRIRSELESLGIRVRTRSEQMRLTPTRQVTIPNIDRYAERYLAGEGLNNLAIDANVAQGTMRKYLARHGVRIRPRSTTAANAAARGSRRSAEQLARRAEALAGSTTFAGPHEFEFAELLDDLGVEYVQQAAIGKYNVDFALNSPGIAVEIVSGGGNRRMNATRRERLEDILNRGWHVVEIFLTGSRQGAPGIGSAEYVVALAKVTSGQPSGRGHHWMIWGDGQPVRASRRQLNGVALVDSAQSSVDAASGDG